MLDSLKLMFNPSFKSRVSLELREAKANLLHAQAQLESAQCYAEMLKLRVARLQAIELDEVPALMTPIQIEGTPVQEQ